MLIGLIVVLVAAILIYAVVASGEKKSKFNGSRVNFKPQVVAERWQLIETSAASGAAGLKNAISEADKLLDYVLKGKGFGGVTMAERLKKAESRLSDKNAVWRAHKLRNSLVHDMDFDLVVTQAKEALRDFRQALVDLGALKG